MKNTKKVLAVVLALTLLLSTFGFSASAATFSDVTSDASYSEAVNILAALQILAGYPDGTFKPDGDITRAEFAAVICRALNLEQAANGAKGTTAFSDVAADHFASGYINMATQQGIISGLGDGTFAPDSNVTWEQAIKMIVAALGYTPIANLNGGYPAGYLAIAAQKNIMDNVSGTNGQNATRAVVSQLVYNALEVPLMKQTGYNEGSPSYSEDANSSLLKSDLRVTKINGIVSSNDFDTTVKLADKKVGISTISSDGTVSLGSDTFYINGTDAASYLGQQVVAYAKTINSRDSIVAITPKVGKNTVVEIDNPANIVGKDGDTFEYWIDKDKDDETTELDLSSDLKVFYNGGYVSDPDGEKDNPGIAKLQPAQGKITFIDFNNDNLYDYAMIDESQDIVVDEVSTKGRVTGIDSGSVTFDKTDTTSQYSITLDGQSIEPSDLQQYDVISVYSTLNGKMKRAVVTRGSTVDGKITEVTSDTPNKYKIGDEYYEISPSVSDDDSVVLSINDEGTFYLNADGKIVYNDTTNIVGNYAFVFVAAAGTGVNTTPQIRMMTTDGQVVTKTFNDKVTFYKEDGTKKADNNFTQADFAGMQNKVITYKLNSDGDINYIEIVDNAAAPGISQDLTNLKYNKPSNYFSGKELSSSAVVFSVIGGDLSQKLDESDVTVTNVDSFVDREDYDVALFDNSKDITQAILTTDVRSKIAEDAQLFVVKSVGDAITDDDQEVKTIIGFYAGAGSDELQSFTADIDLDENVTKLTDYTAPGEDEDYGIFTEGAATENDIVPGCIISMAFNANNEVSAARIIYSAGSKLAQGFANGYITKEESNTQQASYVIGEVYAKSGNSWTIGTPGLKEMPTSDFTVVNVKGCNFGSYDYTMGRAIADVSSADVLKVSPDFQDRGSIVIIKCVDQIPSDVIILK